MPSLHEKATSKGAGVCSHCGRGGEKLLRCGRCQQVAYCGPDCQRAAWPAHKAACAKTVKAASAGPQGQAEDGAKSKAEETRESPETPAPSIPPAPATKPTPSAEIAVARNLLPAPLPAGQQPRIVGVLSTHVGNSYRLERLRYCFASISQQTRRLGAFYMVWSAPDSVAPDVEAAISKLREAITPSPVLTLRQTRRTSQFYDVRWLYDELLHKEPTGTWLIYTDDDDLWGPQRVEAYFTVVSQHGSSAGVTAVCATHKVRPSKRGKLARSAQEVSMHLTTGDARHCGGVRVEEEFFDFSCPVESLGAFLRLCNEETLLHPFADLRFTRFMSEYYDGGRVMYFPTDQVWVYYYSTAYRTPEDHAAFEQFEAQDQASTVVRVREEDLDEAKALCEKQHPGHKPSKGELDEMADLVSSLRQNIDGVLIRHFPDEPMDAKEMKRIAVGQCQGSRLALQICERLARQSCGRFGIDLK